MAEAAAREATASNASHLSETRAAVHKLFHRVGKRDAHAPPKGASETDVLLHSFYVASEGKKHWTDTYERQRKEMLSQLNEAIEEVTPGDQVLILRGDLLGLLVEKYAPSSRFDKTKMTTELAKQGWTLEQVDDLVKRCTVENQGQRRLKVVSL